MRAKKGKPSSSPYVNKVAKSISAKDAEDFSKSLAELKMKKVVLSVLKDMKEPNYLNEDDEQGKVDPISTTFPVKEIWSKYIHETIGQPLSDKEIEATNTFKEDTGKQSIINREPSGRVLELWYKGTDNMGINKTTIVKKMKDSGQFSFVSCQKTEKVQPEVDKEKQMDADKPEDVGGPDLNQPPSPELGAAPGSPTPPTETPDTTQQKQEEEKDDIIVTKSILFKDDIKGASILVEFLKKLNL